MEWEGGAGLLFVCYSYYVCCEQEEGDYCEADGFGGCEEGDGVRGGI